LHSDRLRSDMQSEGCGLEATLGARPMSRHDHALRQQRLQSDLDGTAAQASATIQEPAILRSDALTDLVERDVVALLLETKGATDDVQQHLELCTTQTGHQVIE